MKLLKSSPRTQSLDEYKQHEMEKNKSSTLCTNANGIFFLLGGLKGN